MLYLNLIYRAGQKKRSCVGKGVIMPFAKCKYHHKPYLIASRVTEDDLTLNVDSWADSQLFNAAATWTEYTASDNDCLGMSAPYKRHS